MTRSGPTYETSTRESTDWRDLAECRNYDPGMWFPLGTTLAYAWQFEKAVSICRSCPVIEACRSWALENREPFGVWGGMTEEDRKRYHRAAARAAKAARDAEEFVQDNQDGEVSGDGVQHLS